jgi:hypothetical protein
MVLRVLSAALILITLILSVRHGWGLLSSSAQARAMAEELRLGRTGQIVLGSLVLVSGVLLVPPATFVVGNLLGASLILLVTILQLRVRNFKGALIEIPFFLLPFLMIYLCHPLRR